MNLADQGTTVAVRPNGLRGWPLRCGLVLAAVIAASVLRYGLDVALGFTQPFIFFYPVIMASALLGGVGPGLLATFSSVLIAWYFFLEPLNSFALPNPRDGVGLLLFIAMGGAMSTIGGFFRARSQRLRKVDDSLRLFRTLMDHSTDAVEVIDPETLRVLDVNETCCRHLGYTRGELLSMTVFDFDPNLDEARRSTTLEKLRRNELVLSKTVHKRKDGSVFPVETSLRYVRLDREYLLAISRDISARITTEQALCESEDRYRDLVEHTEDLICTHDLDGRLLSVNSAPARALGYDTSELVALPMRQLIAPEFREQFDQYLERIRQNGKDEGLLSVLTRSGERRVWEYRNTLRTEGVAQPIVRGVAHDVTERRAAEQRLRDQDERLQLFVQHAPAAIAVFDREMRYLQASQRWLDDYALGARDLCGISHYDVFPEIPERWKKAHRRGLAGEVVQEEIDSFKRADGTLQWLRWGIRPWHEANGEIGGIAIFTEDITEQHQAQERLRQSEERFRIALKDSPISVFNQDRDLRYTWTYNPQLYWQQEVLGKTDDELLGVSKAAKLTDLKRKVLNTGVALREEVNVVRDGRIFVFDLNLEPLFDGEGNVVGVTGTCMDVARLRELADRLEVAKERLTHEKSYLENEIRSELGFKEIIGQSPALTEVLRKAQIVAPTDSTVLLLGETGTGKELMARSIHSLSSRAQGSFVKLNCAAVPSGLLESELFGFEKGAFTSAVTQKVGRVELADKGTLFLDEIGELPPELQPKLLRVLQDREFERLGGVRTLRVDVRIIAATNRDLKRDVDEKRFREDLFYRLNVFPLKLPALRERRDDIPVLVCHFLGKHAARMGKTIEFIPDETMAILQNWNWPGNIRELENMIERMVILSKGRVLASPPAELLERAEIAADSLSEMERDHIIRVLRETRGMLAGNDGAASRLGIKRTTLQSMLKRFGIEARDFRRSDGMANGA